MTTNPYLRRNSMRSYPIQKKTRGGGRREINYSPRPHPIPDQEKMGDEYIIPTKTGDDVSTPDRMKRSSTPSLFASTELSTRRLRSNSGGPMPHEDYLSKLTPAEYNSIAPPAPIHKIVLTGGPCGGKTTALARVSVAAMRRCLYCEMSIPRAGSSWPGVRIGTNEHDNDPPVPLLKNAHPRLLLHVEPTIFIFPSRVHAPHHSIPHDKYQLSPYLRERGFEVITCPEAFSLLVTNGMSFDYLGAVEGMSDIVQDTVMDIQIGLEDGFERVLRARGRPGVLLCDRGLMDGSAYMSPEAWGRLLDKRDVRCVSELREGRYNAVFHLVTAAEGAEQFYTLENNAARTETPDAARHVDHVTRNAWVGHPNLVIFDNSTDFERKMQRVVEETGTICDIIDMHVCICSNEISLRRNSHADVRCQFFALSTNNSQIGRSADSHAEGHDQVFAQE
jgi:predicted ATPase